MADSHYRVLLYLVDDELSEVPSSQVTGAFVRHDPANTPNNFGGSRLSAEEQARVQSVADAKHLPASTLVRSWILERLDQESA